MKAALNGLIGMIYPNVCEICGRALIEGERMLCLHCLSAMPLADFHQFQFNTIHQRLAPTPPIERAAALFHYYRDDPYARLLQTAKYNGRPAIGRELGRMLAAKLRPTGFFEGIDKIVPVPMHWFKKMKRGYNQTDWIARGVSEESGIKIADALKVARSHASQTRKGIEARSRNAAGAYSMRRYEAIKGCRHILLIDDIITTGATLHECAKVIHQAEPTSLISVLTIGSTHLR